MNMTRAIIEGIHEVELQVTPEFQKPGKLSVYHVHDLLTGLGWKQETTDVPVETDDGGAMVKRSWSHPNLPGVLIVALRHADKSGSAAVADPDVAEIYSWRADWGVSKIAPNLAAVKAMAEFLAASFGLAKLGAMGQEVATGEKASPADASKVVREKIEAVGWEMKKATSGGGRSYFSKMTFACPGVVEVIEVRVGKDGGILDAHVTLASGNISIITPEIDEIVKRASAIKSWVSR